MNAGQIRQTYRWMSHVYDPLFRRFYRRMRTGSIEALGLAPADTVAVVGAGTGLDLPLLPGVSRVVCFDLSPEMLRHAARALSVRPADLVLADGACLPLRDASVTAVVLHLVLSVAPDPAAVLHEAARILPPGGRIAVLDHFAPADGPELWRRLLGRFPRVLGTHLDRSFEEMMAGAQLSVVKERSFLRGAYRLIVLAPPTTSPA